MPLNNPLVSVVMPVYQVDKYLSESIESILNQTLNDFELIIICDDPSNRTIEIINNYQNHDTRIRVMYQNRSGLTASLNKGFSIAKGKYIARMDADDISHPERLQKQVCFLEMNVKCSLVCTHIECINESGNFSGYWKADIKTKTAQDIKRQLPIKNCIAQPTVMIRSLIFKNYHYDPELKISEDYDLWLRMASDNLILCKLPEFLLKYRRHSLSLTKEAPPGSLRIKCKLRYLYKQGMQRKFSQFNIKVLVFLLLDFILWPFSFMYLWLTK